MSATTATAAPTRRNASAKWFLRHALGYWKGPQSGTAWALTIAALALVLTNLAVNVGINQWNRWFFDALERKDGSTLSLAIITIVALIAAGAASAVAMIRCRMTLQVRWRQWLTGDLLKRWLSDQRYYRLAVSDEEQINPEYRIADDSAARLRARHRVRHRLHQCHARRHRLRRHPVLGRRFPHDHHRRHGDLDTWLHRHRRADLRRGRHRIHVLHRQAAGRPRCRQKRERSAIPLRAHPRARELGEHRPHQGRR